MNTAFKTESGTIGVSAEYCYLNYFRSVHAVWNPEAKCWELPYTREAWESVQASVAGVTPDNHILEELAEPYSDVGRRPCRAAPAPPLKKSVALYKHQQEAYSEAWNLFRDQGGGGYALLFEMGCGKTLTAIALAGALHRDAGIRRLLVVAPLAVVPVWKKDFDSFAAFDYGVTELIGSCPSKKRALALAGAYAVASQELQVVVINYESTWRMESELKAYHPDMIICDESQRIKTFDSKQAKCMHVLGGIAKYRLILTGTPVSNSPLDFWSQYRFLDPSIFGKSFYSFKSRYAVIMQDTNHATGRSFSRIVGYSHLRELCAKAHNIAYRVTKATALDLPEEVSEYLYCDFEPAAYRVYSDVKRECYAVLKAGGTITTPHIVTKLLRLSQICGGFVNKDLDAENAEKSRLEQVSCAKLDLFKETAGDYLDGGKKLVVFARFRAEIDAIVRVLSRCCGLKAENIRVLNGDTPSDVRGQYVADFQNDPSVRCFVANQQCAGIGITLTAADTIIFYSCSYSFQDYAQAKARIHRIGQTNKCTYIHLLVRDSIDDTVLEALQSKQDVARMVVDDYKKLR